MHVGQLRPDVEDFAKLRARFAVAPVSPPAKREPLDNEALRRFATKTASTMRTRTRARRREKFRGAFA